MIVSRCTVCMWKKKRISTSWPKWVLHWVRSSASSFNFHYFFFSLKSCSSFLRLLPRLLAHLSFMYSFNNVFQKAVSTQDMTNAFSLVIFCRIFLFTLTQCNTGLTGFVLVGMRDITQHLPNLSNKVQGEHKVFPWIQTFITRKLRGT